MFRSKFLRPLVVLAVIASLTLNARSVFADSLSVSFEPPTYTTGDIDGQDGWQNQEGAFDYDVEVVDNTATSDYNYPEFGDQSLRISNAVVSGSFGDQTFSKEIAVEAGETTAEHNDAASPNRRSYFSAQWQFASTVPGAEQQGLYFSASPDRGDGARMSWVFIEDTPGGIDLTFSDYQGYTTDPNTEGDFVYTIIAEDLDRSVPHTLLITIEFVDGPSNDIVNVYVNGALAHTGTSWEDYFREQEGNPTRTVDSVLFRLGGGAGDERPAHAGKGFLIDNLTTRTSAPAPTCQSLPATIFQGEPGAAYDPNTGKWTFIGTSGDDVIVGTDTDDIINGGGGDDLICSGDGNDVIDGDGGDDDLYGEADNDLILFDAEDEDASTLADTINGGLGLDYAQAEGSDGVALDLGAGNIEIAYGSSGDDALISTSLPDYWSRVLIYGRAGDDVISGTIGADTLRGEDGEDAIFAGDGNDNISGGPDCDLLFGDTGADRLYFDEFDCFVLGGDGYDTADGRANTADLSLDVGGSGIEVAYGGEGDDFFVNSDLPDSANRVLIYGRGGDDIIYGTTGPDLLRGEVGDDDIHGDGGNDNIDGNAGADELRGNGGNDRLYLDGDDTKAIGGNGYDIADAQLSPNRVTLDVGGSELEVAYGSSRNDIFTSSTLPNGATRVLIYGRDGNDNITGSSGPDLLRGEAGNDTIAGVGGVDTITGGYGADILRGGDDADRLYLDGDDTEVTGGAGYDTADAQLSNDAVTLELGANGIEVAYGSRENDTFTSSALPDTANRVTVYGRDGDDDITGSTGPDALRGDAGDDTIAGVGGADLITGGYDADVLRGGDDSDRLYLDGEDTEVTGGDGYDIADGRASVSAITLDVGGSGLEVAYGSVDDDIFTNSAPPDSATRVIISGRGGDDDITGSSGNDYLLGDDGTDTLNGDDGDDRLHGGPGPDAFSGGGGTNDRATDFNAGEGDTEDGSVEHF